jgi:hypothetical protein
MAREWLVNKQQEACQAKEVMPRPEVRSNGAVANKGLSISQGSAYIYPFRPSRGCGYPPSIADVISLWRMHSG